MNKLKTQKSGYPPAFDSTIYDFHGEFRHAKRGEMVCSHQQTVITIEGEITDDEWPIVTLKPHNFLWALGRMRVAPMREFARPGYNPFRWNHVEDRLEQYILAKWTPQVIITFDDLAATNWEEVVVANTNTNDNCKMDYSEKRIRNLEEDMRHVREQLADLSLSLLSISPQPNKLACPHCDSKVVSPPKKGLISWIRFNFLD